MLADFFKKDIIHVSGSGCEKDTHKSKTFRNRLMTALIVAAGAVAPAFSQTVEPQQEPVKDKIGLSVDAQKAFSITALGDTLLSYRVSGDTDAQKRISGMIDKMAQTHTGLSVLKEVQEHGCKISMMAGMGNMAGLFVPEHNAIYLNSVLPDSVLCSTLVHEASHAQQVHNSGYVPGPELTAQSMIMLARAMEADATKNQIQASFELLEKGDESVWRAVMEEKPGLVLDFLTAKMKYISEPDSVAKHTMLSYYKNVDYMALYEQNYTRGICMAGATTPLDKLDKIFCVSVPADSIVSKVCVLDGNKYMGTDGSVLRDSTTNYIQSYTKSTLEFAASFVEYRQMKADSTLTAPPVKGDRSYEQFYVMRKDGSFKKPEALKANTAKKPAVSKTAVAVKTPAVHKVTVKTAVKNEGR